MVEILLRWKYNFTSDIYPNTVDTTNNFNQEKQSYFHSDPNQIGYYNDKILSSSNSSSWSTLTEKIQCCLYFFILPSLRNKLNWGVALFFTCGKQKIPQQMYAF